MANPLAIVLHASAAETASGVGPQVDIGAVRSCVRVCLDLTDLSGTGASISAVLETSRTGIGGIWRQFGVVAPGADPVTFAFADRFVRARWTIGGSSPSATFALSGEAHTLYATPKDIGRLSLPTKATQNIPDSVMADGCLSASDEAEGSLASSYTMPITAWGNDLRTEVSNIAAMTVMRFRGFQPGGGDDLIVKAADDARSWLKRVAAGSIRPPGIIDSAPTVYEGGAAIFTNAARGW